MATVQDIQVLQLIPIYWVSQKMSLSNKGAFLTNGHFFTHPVVCIRRLRKPHKIQIRTMATAWQHQVTLLFTMMFR